MYLSIFDTQAVNRFQALSIPENMSSRKAIPMGSKTAFMEYLYITSSQRCSGGSCPPPVLSWPHPPSYRPQHMITTTSCWTFHVNDEIEKNFSREFVVLWKFIVSHVDLNLNRVCSYVGVSERGGSTKICVDNDEEVQV